MSKGCRDPSGNACEEMRVSRHAPHHGPRPPSTMRGGIPSSWSRAIEGLGMCASGGGGMSDHPSAAALACTVQLSGLQTRPDLAF